MRLPACKHEPPSCSKGGGTAILILIRAADAPTRVNERAVGAYRAALAAPPSSSLQGWRSSLRQCRHMAREDRCAVARPASALRPLQDRLQSLSSLGAFGGMAARLRGVARRCRPRWFHGRRHDRESPPARCGRKRGIDRNDLGRSRGGLSTKNHALVDTLGQPLHVELTPGQRSSASPFDGVVDVAH